TCRRGARHQPPSAPPSVTGPPPLGLPPPGTSPQSLPCSSPYLLPSSRRCPAPPSPWRSPPATFRHSIHLKATIIGPASTWNTPPTSPCLLSLPPSLATASSRRRAMAERLPLDCPDHPD